ncbi:hypothetical protein TGRH88_027430 [Toxoplasma gondii]|uniref:Uncharacterized protein n=1 Tax=Toxoplasma gondii TaxID=5811 RepID=A0A7J6KA91_TOXGO|nr:hypothetical protein TGRH88_027430 [Toxoplasma gondii]
MMRDHFCAGRRELDGVGRGPKQPVGGSVVAVAGDLDLTGLLKNTESEISKKRSCEERIRVACRARNLV